MHLKNEKPWEELPKVDHENQKNVNQHYKRLMSTKVTKCDVVDVMSEWWVTANDMLTCNTEKCWQHKLIKSQRQ